MKQVDIDECWIYAGYKNPKGYGRVAEWFPIEKRTRAYSVHAVVYENIVGKVPEGLVLDHLCRITSCINPDHLEPVTLRENTLRSNNPLAINARKTHCVRGHEFTPENLMNSRPRDGRRCKECAKLRYIR